MKEGRRRKESQLERNEQEEMKKNCEGWRGMYIRGKMEKELRRGRRKEEEERKEGQGGKKEW